MNTCTALVDFRHGLPQRFNSLVLRRAPCIRRFRDSTEFSDLTRLAAAITRATPAAGDPDRVAAYGHRADRGRVANKAIHPIASALFATRPRSVRRRRSRRDSVRHHPCHLRNLRIARQPQTGAGAQRSSTAVAALQRARAAPRAVYLQIKGFHGIRGFETAGCGDDALTSGGWRAGRARPTAAALIEDARKTRPHQSHRHCFPGVSISAAPAKPARLGLAIRVICAICG